MLPGPETRQIWCVQGRCSLVKGMPSCPVGEQPCSVVRRLRQLLPVWVRMPAALAAANSKGRSAALLSATQPAAADIALGQIL